jgi:hypothetical protein
MIYYCDTFCCRDLRPTSLDKGQETFRLRLYQLYAWGGPLLIAGIAAILDNLPEESSSSLLRPRFGQQRCWFYGIHFNIWNSTVKVRYVNGNFPDAYLCCHCWQCAKHKQGWWDLRFSRLLLSLCYSRSLGFWHHAESMPTIGRMASPSLDHGSLSFVT